MDVKLASMVNRVRNVVSFVPCIVTGTLGSVLVVRLNIGGNIVTSVRVIAHPFHRRTCAIKKQGIVFPDVWNVSLVRSVRSHVLHSVCLLVTKSRGTARHSVPRVVLRLATNGARSRHIRM